MSSTEQIIFSFFLSFLCVQRVDLLVLYFLFLSFAHVRCGRLCYRLSDSHAAYIRRRQCGAAARQPVGAAARRTKEPIDTKRLIDFSKDRIHLSIFTSCATTIILCFVFYRLDSPFVLSSCGIPTFNRFSKKIFCQSFFIFYQGK